MWIMLTKDVPLGNRAPPKMAIFWSVAWPNEKYSNLQKGRCQRCGLPIRPRSKTLRCECDEPIEFEDDDDFSVMPWGLDHNWGGARKIIYKGEHIRVFPDEFSVIESTNLRQYIFGGGDDNASPSHLLQADGAAEDTLITGALDGDGKMVRDAALVDGCNDPQATAVALGMEITIPDAEIPPLGWYLLRKEYADYFGVEHPIYEQLEQVAI